MPPPECSHMESAEVLYRLLYAALELLRQTGLAAHVGKVHGRWVTC